MRRLVLHPHYDCLEHFREVLCWDCAANAGYLPKRWDSNVLGYWWRRLTARLEYSGDGVAKSGGQGVVK